MKFTINIKGRPDPKNGQLVKLDFVFYRGHHPRVTKVIDITGPYKDWNPKDQCFNGRSSDVKAKNQKLLDLMMKYTNTMTGDQVRQRIRAKGYTFTRIADAIGESKQNLRILLSAENVKSGTLERIAEAMGENVAYFYNKQPIFTLVDYVEYESIKRENELLKQLILEKEEHIRLLKTK